MVTIRPAIRDPFITRGPDGVLYLGLTDLHIFA